MSSDDDAAFRCHVALSQLSWKVTKQARFEASGVYQKIYDSLG